MIDVLIETDELEIKHTFGTDKVRHVFNACVKQFGQCQGVSIFDHRWVFTDAFVTITKGAKFKGGFRSL